MTEHLDLVEVMGGRMRFHRYMKGKTMTPVVPDPSIRIEITVRINQLRSQYGPGSINLTEQLDLPETDFLGLAAIMKQFHDLAITIKEQQMKSVTGRPLGRTE